MSNKPDEIRQRSDQNIKNFKNKRPQWANPQAMLVWAPKISHWTLGMEWETYPKWQQAIAHHLTLEALYTGTARDTKSTEEAVGKVKDTTK